MRTNVNFKQRLKGLNEQLENPSVVNQLFNESKDLFLIKDYTVTKIFQACQPAGEKKIKLHEPLSIGLDLEKIRSLVSAGLTTPKELSKVDKICLNYLMLRVEVISGS